MPLLGRRALKKDAVSVVLVELRAVGNLLHILITKGREQVRSILTVNASFKSLRLTRIMLGSSGEMTLMRLRPR